MKWLNFLLPFKRLNAIMTKIVEVAELVTALVAQLDKAKSEILSKIEELQQQLSDVDLPHEAEAAIEDLKAAVQALDDVVPDQPPTV